ncbi:UDP-glycosyltransferase 76C5-like [Juglans microcarpa x Juglans regia]|uniref:UDP-glycosyltransferase 76C5-like n=1 Tax=Juglans microcarpa x Juglans regia TaxID=2249226 RepID=UPI001B7F480B|nr:UDP-glycosyltransferase 76C5-like [Juglans microcarpa x Juglans regia]
MATILYSQGFSFTVVHPEFNSPNSSNHSDLSFVSIPDGLSKTNVSTEDALATILALRNNFEAPFQRHMEQIMLKADQDDPHDRVAYVVYDGFMHFAQALANHLKLPVISVRTNATASLLAFALFPYPHEQDHDSFQARFCVKSKCLSFNLLCSRLRAN